MSVPTRDLLRWRLDLTWALTEYHLAPLTTEDCLFEPAARCWTVHRGADGRWVPDWADVEPDPVPAPTIGRHTWHVGWWWGAGTDHVLGRTPPERTDVTWPGYAAGAVAWLRERHAGWCAALSDLDLDAPAAYPWPADAGGGVHAPLHLEAAALQAAQDGEKIAVAGLDRAARPAPGTAAPTDDVPTAPDPAPTATASASAPSAVPHPVLVHRPLESLG